MHRWAFIRESFFANTTFIQQATTMPRPHTDSKEPAKGRDKGKGKASDKGMGKAPKKPTQAPTRTSPRKRLQQDPESTETDHTIEHEEDFYDNAPEASTTSSITGSKKRQRVGMALVEISMDTMKRIASWFEGMPMFYDLADPNYKNTQLRDMKLTEFGREIGLSAAAIKRHFVSMRTDHHKLMKDTKKKSGSGGGKRMTPLQSFKLAAYAFLDPYHKPRTQSQTCGKIGGDDGGEESESGDNMSVADEQGPITSAVATAETKKPSASKSSMKGFSEVLVHYLEKSAKETKEDEQKLQAFQTKSAAQKEERTAWTEWLVSVQSKIPEARYLDYQTDSFNLAMRYIRDAQQPQPQLQPQPQQQQLQAFQSPPFTPQPLRAQQQQQLAQLQTSYPARPQSAPPSPFTPCDFGTSLSLGVSPGNSPSLISQAWTLSNQHASPLCTPHQRTSPGFNTFLDTSPRASAVCGDVSQQTLREVCGRR